MRRSTAAALLLAIAAILAACGDDDSGPTNGTGPADQVRLEVEGDRTLPDGVIGVRVVNDSEHSVTGGVCPQLERRTDGDWEPVGRPRACIEIAEVIEPGERSSVLEVPVPKVIRDPADYRIHHEVTLNLPGGEVASLDLTAPVTLDNAEPVPNEDQDGEEARAAGIELVIDDARASKPPTVSAGAAVGVRVQNGTDERITYGACPVLERREGTEWVTVPSEPTACIQIAYSTGPGETGGKLGVETPPDAEPGTYRIRHQVTAEGGEALTVIAPLRVTGR